MMPAHIHITAHALTILFLIGAIGCLISIPIIAVKFAAVLFEKDTGEDEEESATVQVVNRRTGQGTS